MKTLIVRMMQGLSVLVLLMMLGYLMRMSMMKMPTIPFGADDNSDSIWHVFPSFVSLLQSFDFFFVCLCCAYLSLFNLRQCSSIHSFNIGGEVLLELAVGD